MRKFDSVGLSVSRSEWTKAIIAYAISRSNDVVLAYAISKGNDTTRTVRQAQIELCKDWYSRGRLDLLCHVLKPYGIGDTIWF